MEQDHQPTQVVQKKTSLTTPVIAVITGVVALGIISFSLIGSIFPRIFISSPASFATVDGTKVNLVAVVRDKNNNKVKFFIDYKSIVTNNTCTVTTCTGVFNSTATVDGRHVVMAKLFSPAGRLLASSANYNFYIRNKKVITITAPTQNASVKGTTDIVTKHPSSAPPELIYTFTVTRAGGQPVNLGTKSCSKVCAYSWNTLLMENGAYTIKVVGKNNGGKVMAESGARTVVVSNVTVPTVETITIVYPTEGATVSGTKDIIVDAVTPNAVNATPTGLYSFYLDQALIGSVDCTSGTSCRLPWVTTRYMNGQHVLLVSASNASGQVIGRSLSRKVTISNVVVSPATIKITMPTPDSTVSGSVDIIANYSGSGTIEMPTGGYTFYFDDSILAAGKCLGLASCTFVWNTVQYPSGLHTLMVTAANSNGNILGRSSPVSVTVKNNSTISQLIIAVPSPAAKVSGTINVRVYGSSTGAVLYKAILSDPTTKKTVAQNDCTSLNLVCEIPWDTTVSANGAYLLSVEATTANGTLVGLAPGQTVYVSN